MNYVFDIDGVLTSYGIEMEQDSSDFFKKWIKGKTVSVVSGSSYDRIVVVLEEDIISSVDKVFACAGTRAYRDGEMFFQHDPNWPEDLHQTLRFCLLHSDFPKEHRSKIHIEDRGAMLNFSIIGRPVTKTQRRIYVEWDKKMGERQQIQDMLNSMYNTIDCNTGGSISLDIVASGSGKHLILDHIDGDITFFGDRCYPGGNDYSLSCALEENNQTVHKVNGWEETRKILEKIDG